MPIDPLRPFRNCAAFYATRRYRIGPLFARLVAARLGLTGQERLLDLGCGPGILAERFAPYAREVVAADPEPDMLAEGVRYCADAGAINVSFVRADSHDLSPVAGGGPFAAVTIGQAFHWMRPQDQALANLAAVTGSTAAIAIITPDAVSEPAPWCRELDVLFEEYLSDVPNGDHPGGRHAPFDEILRQSAFSQVEEFRFEYEVEERPNLQNALEVRYAISWVLDRLGDRREALEAEARERLGWVDELPPHTVRRRDTALFGFRPGAN